MSAKRGRSRARADRTGQNEAMGQEGDDLKGLVPMDDIPPQSYGPLIETTLRISDEIRMLTGRTTAPVPGLSFYDAWEVAGPPAPGHTWSNNNPWATQLLWPDRRIDYIFSATPRPGGAGHPIHTALLGIHPVNNTYPSDHYALQSDLRY
jgi:hypothetical protein